jgi:hypothetical protein
MAVDRTATIARFPPLVIPGLDCSIRALKEVLEQETQDTSKAVSIPHFKAYTRTSAISDS